MKLIVNGEQTEYDGEATLTALLTHRGSKIGSVAVALNQEFVSRSKYDETEIKDGDDIEIVAPMQGG